MKANESPNIEYMRCWHDECLTFYSAVGYFILTLPRIVRDAQSVPQDVPQGVPEDGLSLMDAKLVKYVRRHSKVITEKLASMLGCAPKTVKRHLAKLPNVHYVGHGYSGHWEVDAVKGG